MNKLILLIILHLELFSIVLLAACGIYYYKKINTLLIREISLVVLVLKLLSIVLVILGYLIG